MENTTNTIRNNREKSEDITDDIGEILYKFTTPEFEKHERGQLWIIVFSLCVVSGVLIGVFSQSLSVVLLSVMIGFVYTITYNQNANEITVAFTDIGMFWKNQFFSYQEIENFWIFYIPHETKRLHISIKKGNGPREIIIPIQSQKIKKIRKTLGYYIPEDEDATESLHHSLTRTLKL